MRGAQLAGFLLLLVSSCQGIPASPVRDLKPIFPRSGGSSGSRSPSPARGSGLLGDIVAQGMKKHGQSSQTKDPHQGQGQTSQVAHADPAELIQPGHSVRPAHTTISSDAVQAAHTAHPTHLTGPAHAAHPAAAHPFRPGRKPRPAKPAQQVDTGHKPLSSNTMYEEWTKGLTGPLARQKPGRQRGRVLLGLATGPHHGEEEWGEIPGATSGGTLSRSDRSERYREKKRLKKEAERLGVKYSAHEEHPGKGGGNGGGPGSPGAGSQAVSK